MTIPPRTGTHQAATRAESSKSRSRVCGSLRQHSKVSSSRGESSAVRARLRDFEPHERSSTAGGFSGSEEESDARFLPASLAVDDRPLDLREPPTFRPGKASLSGHRSEVYARSRVFHGWFGWFGRSWVFRRCPDLIPASARDCRRVSWVVNTQSTLGEVRPWLSGVHK